MQSWWGLRSQSLVGSVHELICIISASLVFSRVPPGPLSHSSLSSLDDDYSDTYNATYAVINSGETCFTHTQDSSVCLLLSSAWSRLNSSVLFPNRWLQPVVQPYHGPPRAADAHLQAARQKPLQQRRWAPGAVSIPSASSSSAHAFHPAAEG